MTEKKKSIIASHLKKDTKTMAEIEQEILDFLNFASTKPGRTGRKGCPLKHGLASVLSTVHNNIPRATPVDFFNDGLEIWIAGEPGLKIRNIRQNPVVAVGIYHPMDHTKPNRSLQITGKASLLTLDKQNDLFMSKMKQFGIYDAAKKMISEKLTELNQPLDRLEEEVINGLKRFNLIRIVPEEIIMLTIDPEKGAEKNVWHQKDAA